MAGSISDFQRKINTLRDKVARGEASVKESAMVEYYDHTRGGAPLPADPFAAKVFSQPFSYSMMKDWAIYRQAEAEAYGAFRKTTESARRRNFFNASYTQARERRGYTGTLEQWKKDFVKNEAAEAYAKTNYNPHLAYTKFQRTDPSWSVQNVNTTWAGKDTPYTRPIVTLDIETDDYNRPITISAIKSAFNKKTGQMEIIDTYERFYRSLDKNLVHTNPTHGLTRNILDKLRKQQGADYSWTYEGWGLNKGKEKEALNKFLGNSILVGHNIHDFDLPNLFGKRVKNQVVDTLMAARNIWGDTGHNSLDQVFKRVFGVTMEQAGLPHHDSMSDTIATAMIYEAMTTSQTPTGSALRKILRHGDLNLAPVDLNIDTDVGGSQLIRGPYWRYALQNVRDYVDRYGKTGVDYMSDTKSELEVLEEQIQTGMHYTGPRKGAIDPDAAKESDTSVVMESLAESIENLSTMLGTIKEAGVDIQGFGSTMSQYRRAQYIQLMSRSEYDNEGVGLPGSMKKVARGLGISDRDYDVYREAATAIKESREYSDTYKELRHLTRQGLGDTGFVKSMRASLADTWADWGPAKLKELERDREYAAEMEFRKKSKYLRSAQRRGSLSDEQMSSLWDLEGSYDDLVDATEELVKKNQQLLQVYGAIGKIKMYDPNQYLASARNQATGIFGSARGVVPSFLLSPASRLTDATFNYYQGKLTGFNAISRTWNSGIGSAVTGALGATMGTMGFGVGTAITGGVNAVSQVVGNIGQYRLEKAGFAIQNTLNTLGAAAAWVTTPFQLLGKAAKTLLGGFTGLSWSLSHLMKGGLTEMGSMGNPLSDLTGVDYSSYQGTTMMDVASLFNKGSMNSTYEDFARQQRAFYTTGEVNTNRLISASLLGIYSDVYGPDTQVDTKTRYNNMVNGLLQRMEGQSEDQRAQTLYLASQIDSNLPGLLRTARMLNVTDINTLMDPSERDMYWRPVDSVRKNKKGLTEEQQFRWDQYEFGAARTQFSVTKMRFADKLWNAVGKDLYNGFNRISDSALKGDWTSAITEATNLWDRFKVKFVGVWDDIKKTTTGEGGGKGFDWAAKFTQVFTKIGIAALEIVRTINNAWGQLVGIIADKASGLISYLSTVSIKPHWDGGKLSWEIQTVKDTIHNVDTSKGIAKSHSWTQDPQKGWQFNWAARGSYEELARQLFPTYTDSQLSSLTVEDLRKKLMDMRDTWTDPEGNAGKFLTLNGSKWVPDSEQSINYLLGLAGLEPGREFEGGVFAARSEGFRLRDPHYGTQYGDALRRATTQMNEEVINPIIDAAQDELRKTTQRLEMNIKVNDKSMADVIMENGKATVDKVGSMLSSVLLGNNMSVQVSNQR